MPNMVNIHMYSISCHGSKFNCNFPLPKYRREGIVFETNFCFLLLIHGRESTVFGSNFRNGHFDGFTYLRSPESENYIFLRLICVCVCYQHNSKTSCSRNFKFDILHLNHMEMLIHYSLWTEFLVSSF